MDTYMERLSYDVNIFESYIFNSEYNLNKHFA